HAWPPQLVRHAIGSRADRGLRRCDVYVLRSQPLGVGPSLLRGRLASFLTPVRLTPPQTTAILTIWRAARQSRVNFCGRKTRFSLPRTRTFGFLFASAAYVTRPKGTKQEPKCQPQTSSYERDASPSPARRRLRPCVSASTRSRTAWPAARAILRSAASAPTSVRKHRRSRTPRFVRWLVCV